MNRFLLAFIITNFSLSAFAYKADTVKTFYETRQIKDLKISIDGKLFQGFHFLPNSDIAFICDSKKKTLDTYIPLEYLAVAKEDTLENLFYEICHEYTLRIHSYIENKNDGNGIDSIPSHSEYCKNKNRISEITNYKGTLRNGNYELYAENGSLLQKGQFRNDEKVGVWIEYDENGIREKTWFISGNYLNKNGKSLSITYTIIPVFITISILFVLGFLITKIFNYNIFYVSLATFTNLLFLSLLKSENFLADDSYNPIKHFIYNYFAAISLTLFFSTFVLSIINLFILRHSYKMFVFSYIEAFIGFLIACFIALCTAVSGGGMIG